MTAPTNPGLARAIYFVKERIASLEQLIRVPREEQFDRMDRWRHQTAAGLAENVTAQEAARFSQRGAILVASPDFFTWSKDPRETVFVKTATNYLRALLSDLESNPERVFDARAGTQRAPRLGASEGSIIRVFVCHSSEDAMLAGQVVSLMRLALNLEVPDIRCTSVDGYELGAGADIDERLRAEALGAEAFIAIVSAASVVSAYVIFEMGARWGTGKKLIPFLAPGMTPSALPGPLGGKTALFATNRADVQALVTDVGNDLGITPQPAASYDAMVQVIASLPTAAASTPQRLEAGTEKLLELRDLLVSLRDRGVHDILNAKKTNRVLDTKWLLEHELWKDEVIAALEPWRLVHRFDPLVFVEDREVFRQVPDEAFRKQLNMLGMRLDRLGTLIEEIERGHPVPRLDRRAQAAGGTLTVELRGRCAKEAADPEPNLCVQCEGPLWSDCSELFRHTAATPRLSRCARP